MKWSAIAVAVVAAGVSSGCASIVKGTGPEKFTVQSRPPGADVKIFELPTNVVVASGKTPFTTALKKSRGFFQGAKYKVTLELPGFQTREALVDTRVSGWYVAGNIVFGGLIGWLIVDPATGAMWTLSSEQIDVPLEPPGVSPPAPQEAPASSPSSSLDGPHIGVVELENVPLSARLLMVPVN